jgi:hypothetical protein
MKKLLLGVLCIVSFLPIQAQAEIKPLSFMQNWYQNLSTNQQITLKGAAVLGAMGLAYVLYKKYISPASWFLTENKKKELIRNAISRNNPYFTMSFTKTLPVDVDLDYEQASRDVLIKTVSEDAAFKQLPGKIQEYITANLKSPAFITSKLEKIVYCTAPNGKEYALYVNMQETKNQIDINVYKVNF